LAKFLREALIFVGLTDIPAPERIGNKLRERFGPMLAELRKSRPSQLIRTSWLHDTQVAELIANSAW
jgi:hypothetical protein